MGRKSCFSDIEKINACKMYDVGKGSFRSIATKIGVAETTLRRWHSLYKYHGADAFDVTVHNQSYKKEDKIKIVDEYNNGKLTALELSGKYKIALSVVHNWINRYNNGVEIRDYEPKGAIYTMKSAKTTFEERLEIVRWVIDNDMNYKEAAHKNGIKYSLVYQWVQKYMQKGPEALKYKKRGPKSVNELDESNLSDVEKLKLELEREKRLRQQVEFELEVLKKKEEFEKKLHTRK
tara:strand:+ start:398 stop:1102 length:705 start_codon:yes stop_codon:yes gene_type:complete